MAIPDAFTSAPIVLRTVTIHLSNRVERTGGSGSMMARVDIRGVIRIMDTAGLTTMRTTGLLLDGALANATCHARLIRSDGTVRELPEDAARLTDQHGKNGGAQWLVVDPSDAAVGADIEFEVDSWKEGPLRFEALYLQEEVPVVSKEIILDVDASLTPHVQTFHGFPPYETDPVGAQDRRRKHLQSAEETDRYRWRAGPLAAMSGDPLLLRRDCLPFLRMRGSSPDIRAQATKAQTAFNSDFPHITVHGRAHENDFTRFVEGVRAKYPYGSVTAPIAEVLRFLHDSVSVVDMKPGQARSVGEYFHDRRIPQSRVVSLYRSLFIILGIPFDVGYARSIYLEALPPDSMDIMRATHMLLGFRDEGSDSLHTICPATCRGAWLLDELPMELAGTTATFYRFRRGLMPPDGIFRQRLAALRIVDNGRIERRSVIVNADGTVTSARISGAFTGQPAALVQHALTARSNKVLPSDLDARVAAWFAQPQGTRREPVAATDPMVRTCKYDDALDGNPPPLPAASDLKLRDLFEFPFLQASLPSDTCAFLLPFPFFVRSDIAIQASACKDFTFQGIPDVSMENQAGLFSISTERTMDGAYLIHLEYVNAATLVDRTTAQRIGALMRSASEALGAPLFKR